MFNLIQLCSVKVMRYFPYDPGNLLVEIWLHIAAIGAPLAPDVDEAFHASPRVRRALLIVVNL